jgi:hypothetical protein
MLFEPSAVSEGDLVLSEARYVFDWILDLLPLGGVSTVVSLITDTKA